MNLYKFLGYASIFFAVFGVAYHYNARFLDWLRFQSIGTRDYVVQRLALMFMEYQPHHILIAMFSLSFGMGSVVFLLFLPNIFPGLIFGALTTIVGWKLPRPLVDYLYKRRVQKFTAQMVDGLSLMSNGLKSGLSVVQSLGLVSQEMPNPIKEEFSLILNQNQLGASLEESFSNLARRVQSDDVEMFVTAVNILKETGGNMAETFDTIVVTIRERVKIEQKIAAMTSQGFYQGVIVALVPPVLGISLSLSDPEFIAPLFNTTLGWVLVLVIILLEIVGFFVIMRVIKIDV